MSKEVAVPEQVDVPDLAPTPASTITAEDIIIPTLYMGHQAQTIVANGLAKPGDIYAAASQDDSEAQILFEYDAKNEHRDDGLLIHPLFMFKSWSFSPGPGQQLEMWPFEARGRAYPDGPPLFDSDPKNRAWLTYNYTLFVPDADPEMPFRTRFYRSGAPAAMKINQTVIRSSNPMLHHAFRWSTKRVSRQGIAPWTVPVLNAVEAKPEHVEQARALFLMILPGLQQRAAAVEEVAPAI